jgi:MYXO-CTERM domain-containing protein
VFRAPDVAKTPVADTLATTTVRAPDPDRAARVARAARPFPPAPSLPFGPDGLAATWVSASGSSGASSGALFALLLGALLLWPPRRRTLLRLARSGPRIDFYSLLLERPG